MSEKLEKLVEMLDELTLLEAADLSKMLQDKWGVSAAPAAVAVAGATPFLRRAGEFLADVPEELRHLDVTVLHRMILQDTLGVAPMAETRQLYEQMAQAWPDRAAGEP